MQKNNRRLYVGITGKRALSGAQQDTIKPILATLLEKILQREKNTNEEIELIGISPLAEGTDTLFAEAVMDKGYKLKILLPFEKEEYEKDFTNQWTLKKFQSTYDSVTLENKEELDAISNAPRNTLYLNVGKKVVDTCDYIIAIWDEVPGKPGGTADVVKYLLDRNEQEIWTHTGNFKQIISINITNEQPVITWFHPIETDAAAVEQSLPIFLSARKIKHDLLSARLKKAYEKIWRTCLWMGIATTICFSAWLILNKDYPAFNKAHSFFSLTLTMLEFAFIIGILLLIRVKRPQKTHGNSLLHRFIAEQFRTLNTYFWANVPLPSFLENPLLQQLAEHHGWNIPELKCVLATKNRLSDRKINNPRKKPVEQLIAEQLNYHSKRLEKTNKKLHLHEKRINIFLWLFVVAVAIHLLTEIEETFSAHPPAIVHTLLHFFHQGPGKSVLLFFSIVLPALIAREEATKVFREWEKLSLQSLAMKRYFEAQNKRLTQTGNDGLQDIVDDINQQMYYENLEWQLSMFDKSTPLPG